ncbi:MAG: hypothetical protein H0Z32_06725 [Bacillaceae bacterium]|nr:hypothetical protein [Bacillaceae bacterium]
MFPSSIMKKNTLHDPTPIVFAIAITIFIGSFIFPFIIIYVVRDIFFRPDTYWIFQSPFSSYMTFMSGMMLMSMALLVFLFFNKRKGIKLASGVLAALTVVSLWLLSLGVYNYYYFNEHGIHYNHLFSYRATHYHWDDFSTMLELKEKEKGTTRLKELIFITKDGEELSFPFQQHFWNHKHKITSFLEYHGASIEDRTIVVDD